MTDVIYGPAAPPRSSPYGPAQLPSAEEAGNGDRVTIMAASLAHPHFLDQPPENSELNLVSELFHRLNRIIPQDQTVLTFPPNYIVRKAVARMREHGYSQVPVVTGEDQTLVPKITDGMGLLC